VRVLTAEMPLHLEDHLEAATFSEVPTANGPKTDPPTSVEWRFDRPQPGWKASPMWNPGYRPAALARTADSLRVTFTQQTRFPNGRPAAGIHVDVPNWDRRDWAEVVIRLRAAPATAAWGLMVGFNVRAGPGSATRPLEPFEFQSEGGTTVVPNGAIQTYRIRVNSGQAVRIMHDPWRQLGLWFFQWSGPWSRTADSVEILSVTVVPKGATPSPTTVEWRFDQPQPDWQPILPNRTVNAALKTAVMTRTTEALRVTLPEGSRQADNVLRGGIYVDLPGWRREEWAHLIVRARTTSVTDMILGLNPQPGAVPANAPQASLAQHGGITPIVSDGSVQTYQIRPNWGGGPGRTGPWLRVGLLFSASAPGTIDILSVSVVPMTTLYAGERTGVRSIAVAGTDYRRSVFTHAPGRVQYRVRVPESGRLHASLGVLDQPVEFRVTVQPSAGAATTIFRETHLDPEQWADRTVDLASFAGQIITLGFEASAGETGAIAFWGAPTLSGEAKTDKPNVILYVIDGGGADYMSGYGYNRRTTPNLEKLAAEGALFEHAYSNSSSTSISTPSFMTSLQSSVLGKTRPQEPMPESVLTMAQRFHQAGYQTAVLTANPNAAGGLEQGADAVPFFPFQNDAVSSVKLHDAFWSWRERTSGHPYWVHFQTTDLHAIGRNTYALFDGVPVAPFGGLFVSPDEVRTLRDWSRLVLAGGGRITSTAFTSGAVDRVAFLTLYQGMYDQQMAHQDYQLGRLIERLKASGEWQNTLLIVAADHSIGGSFTDTAIGRLDPLPPRGIATILRPSFTRVPLIVNWPGHITGGRRFSDPVSLIDLLPTVLDLTGLPMPDVMQGQSLAPLLRGDAGWTARPVILDEVTTNAATGQLRGELAVVDGRWGASLWIGPPRDEPDDRPWPVLLFDLWNDPLCIAPVNEQQEDLVDYYLKFLTDQWKAHQALAKQFKPGPKSALTPEQLERLRSLGYIR
jgi:arylsulfatase A-like enzyme